MIVRDTTIPLPPEPAPIRLKPQTERATTAYRICEVLREAIVSTQIRPGDALSAADIARQLGVSRQPVREAFIMLAERGLVDVVPQRGTFVLKISMKAVRNAQFVREAIEVAVARRACQVHAESDISAIRSLVASQKEAFAAGDHRHFLRLDEAFHQRIAEAAQRAQARKSIEAVKAQLDRVRFLSLPMTSHMRNILEEHEAILAALVARDADEAEQVMRQHVATILNYLPEVAKTYSEMFSEDDGASHEYSAD
jgi:DNA-binding GntR family transcriptional regulator